MKTTRMFSRVAAALLLAATATTLLGAPHGAAAQVWVPGRVRVPGPVVIVPPPPPPPPRDWELWRPIYVPCDVTRTCRDRTQPDRNLTLPGGLK